MTSPADCLLTLDTDIEACSESVARLRAILDGTYEFIGLLSPEGTLLEANRTSLEWVGQTRAELVGRKFWETPWWTRTPGAAEQVRRAVERAATGEFVREEVTLEGPRGAATFDFSLYPVRGERGEVMVLVPEGRNITERVRASKELERRYLDGSKLTEVNRALVGTFDIDQVMAIVCRAARELVGADGATFAMREGASVLYSAEDAEAPLWKGRAFPLDRCVSGWAMLNSQAAVVPDIYADPRVPPEPYRDTFVRSLVMTPVGPGAPVAAFGVYWAEPRQASDYEVGLLASLASAAGLALAGARAYHDARRARAEAEQANRLKDEFLATLSHELRNPLNTIVGFAELLLRSPEASTRRIEQAAQSIRSNARAQARLINDLLDLSRLQTGKLALERKLVDMVQLVADAVETERARAAAKQILLQVELCSPLLVNADAVRVQQVIWNLVNNAVKFTPSGGRVEVRVNADAAHAVLVVEDTGQGIDPAFLPHVFEMFRQGDARTTRAHGGLGIGLALVRQLVERHGGQVEVASPGRGHGSRFTVRLPVRAGGRAAAAEPAASTRTRLEGARVLVIDDTEDSVEMLRLLLASEGACVETALCGEEALRVAARADFDLIISDISMPGMDGYELLATLRKFPRHARTPAVALTGFGRSQDIARARAAGFSFQLTKPLDLAQLLERAGQLLGG